MKNKKDAQKKQTAIIVGSVAAIVMVSTAIILSNRGDLTGDLSKTTSDTSSTELEGDYTTDRSSDTTKVSNFEIALTEYEDCISKTTNPLYECETEKTTLDEERLKEDQEAFRTAEFDSRNAEEARKTTISYKDAAADLQDCIATSSNPIRDCEDEKEIYLASESQYESSSAYKVFRSKELNTKEADSTQSEFENCLSTSANPLRDCETRKDGYMKKLTFTAEEYEAARQAYEDCISENWDATEDVCQDIREIFYHMDNNYGYYDAWTWMNHWQSRCSEMKDAAACYEYQNYKDEFEDCKNGDNQACGQITKQMDDKYGL